MDIDKDAYPSIALTSNPIVILPGESPYKCNLFSRIVIIPKKDTNPNISHVPKFFSVAIDPTKKIALTLPANIVYNLLRFRRHHKGNVQTWMHEIINSSEQIWVAGYEVDLLSHKKFLFSRTPEFIEYIELCDYPQIQLKDLCCNKVFPCRVVVPNSIKKLKWKKYNDHLILGSMAYILRVPENPDVYRNTFPEGMPIFYKTRSTQHICASSKENAFPSLLDLAWKAIDRNKIPLHIRQQIEGKLTTCFIDEIFGGPLTRITMNPNIVIVVDQ